MPAKKDATVEGDWEEIQPFTEPITLDEGQNIVAFYMGPNTVNVPARDDDDDETVIEDEDGRRRRVALIHEFVESAGEEPYGIWGSAVLDKRLADVPANSRVRVLYEGKAELDGGRTARRYRVWVDKSASF